MTVGWTGARSQLAVHAFNQRVNEEALLKP